jgi:hypothetical protein
MPRFGPEYKGAETMNWLPAPADRFVLMLRMYWPKEAVLNGSWPVPLVLPRS